MYSHIQYVQAKDSLSILGYLIQRMVLSVDIALPQLIHVPSGQYILLLAINLCTCAIHSACVQYEWACMQYKHAFNV